MSHDDEISIETYRRRLKSAGILYVDVFPYRLDDAGEAHYLVLRRRPDVVLQDSWQPVCGKIREGERIRDAFARQVFEKTGQRPAQLFKLDYVNTFYDDYYDTIMFVPVAACRLAADTIRIETELHVEHSWVRFGEIGRYLVWRQQLECVKLLDDALTGKTPLSIFHELKTQP